MKKGVYTIEIYEKDGMTRVFISSENSSGCDYKVNNANEVGRVVSDYIDSYDILDSDYT